MFVLLHVVMLITIYVNIYSLVQSGIALITVSMKNLVELPKYKVWLPSDLLSDTIISELRKILTATKNRVRWDYDEGYAFAVRLNRVQNKLREKKGSEMAFYVHRYCYR